MLLIYAHTATARLQYTCHFIFKELMGVDFKLTIDSEHFRSFDGPKINYSDAGISPEEFHIQNHPLLFEQDIRSQHTDCFWNNNNKAFFKTPGSDHAFDILAASFYLLSRYEEYLPHEKDMYGRYDCERSLAYREGFLDRPLINTWVIDLAEKLNEKYFRPTGPSGQTIFNLQHSAFSFLPTYDIDIAYSYKHKGLIRNLGGYLKTPTAERIKVLAGSRQDPFDSYDWLHHLHQHYGLQPVYFFLVAAKKSTHDKNIPPHKDVMWKLVKQHAKKYTLGLHPSWQSGDNRSLLKKEKEQLEAMCECAITRSRQHYIRFNLPEGYQRLIAAGITDDYSMGYGSINGFRASVASSFYWFDLEKNEQTKLRVHPFCFMDANSFYEQRQNTQQTMDEMLHYLRVCREVHGTLISIWHNNFLGTADEFSGWAAIYDEFIAQVQQ